jgi:DNA-binding GntR family transcriptional regulator
MMREAYAEGRTMTTVEKVLNAIKEDLFLNRLKPGQRIKEYALSKRLTVSRSPVREALQRLSAEGLVTLVPRKGAFVVRFSSHQLAELFEVREVIDGIAASLAAVRADSIHIQGLFDCLEMAKSILTRDDIPYYPFDLDFHQKVLGASGNGLLQKICFGL